MYSYVDLLKLKDMPLIFLLTVSLFSLATSGKISFSETFPLSDPDYRENLPPSILVSRGPAVFPPLPAITVVLTKSTSAEPEIEGRSV